jgi:hypothetical protein
MKISYSRFFQKTFLRSDLARVGVATSPGSIAVPKEREWQRIGFINLPLEPPFQIKSVKDVLFVFFNHEAFRLLFCIIWLILCGMIECFMSQLSDIRYSYVYPGKVKIVVQWIPKFFDLLTATITESRHPPCKTFYLMPSHTYQTSN